METVTVRVSSEVRRKLQQLARESNQNMQSVLAQAIEEYRRRQILERANAAYAKLRSQPDLWTEEEEERRLWETTLGDGLEDDQ